MSDLRSMIRELLLEELGTNRPDIVSSGPAHTVELRNDNDLNAFVIRVLDMSKERDLKADIQSGKFQFTLSGSDHGCHQTNRAGSADSLTGAIRFEKGLVTEKDISHFNGSVIEVGNTVCFTPLARDEIRRKKIKIERKPK